MTDHGESQLRYPVGYAPVAQLEHKIQTENDKMRYSVVSLVGRLCAIPENAEVEEFAAIWNGYLQRFNDRKADIRLLCVEQAQNLLINQPVLRAQVSEALVHRSHDTEESIRLAVVKTISGAAKRKFYSVNENLFNSLAERTRDKKFKVRSEAILNLGALYRKVMCNSEFTDSERASFAWVREKLLNVYYHQSIDDRLLIEKVFCSCLVPYSLPADRRMDIMVDTYCSLDDHAARAFDQIIKQQTHVRTSVRQLLESHKTEESSERDQHIEQRLHRLAEQHAEPLKTLDAFKRFYRLISDDQQALQSIEYIVSECYTTKKVEECVKNLLKKMSTDNNSAFTIDAVKTLMERIAPLVIDHEAVEYLVARIRRVIVDDSASTTGAKSRQLAHSSLHLLRIVSESFPYAFRRVKTLHMLIEFLEMDQAYPAEIAMLVFANIGANTDPLFDDVYSTLMTVLQSSAKTGTPTQAKYAVRCIERLSPANKDDIYQQIVESAIGNVSLDNRLATTALQALGAIAGFCPNDYRTRMVQVIKDVVVSTIILSASAPTCNDADADVEHKIEQQDSWLPNDRLPPQCRTKLAGMKFLVRYLRGIKTNDDGMARKTLKMLSAIVEAKGDIHNENKTSASEMAHMRLAAGCCVLNLAEEASYSSLVELDQFQKVAELICDDCNEVRQRFAVRLHKGLGLLRLPIEYMSIFALGALMHTDECKNFRAQLQHCIAVNISKRREFLRKRVDIQTRLPYYMPEYALAYAVHLLAHNKRLTSHDDVAILTEFKECLWFLLEAFWQKKDQANNLEFMYRMFQDIKNSTDSQKSANAAETREYNLKMWSLCDIGMLLLVYRFKIILKETQAKSVLSSRFFTASSSAAANTKVYVPTEIMDDEKRKHAGGKHHRTNADGNVSVKQEKSSIAANRSKSTTNKRRATVVKELTPKRTSTRNKRKASATSDEEEEDDEEDDDDDDEVLAKSIPHNRTNGIKSSSTPLHSRAHTSPAIAMTPIPKRSPAKTNVASRTPPKPLSKVALTVKNSPRRVTRSSTNQHTEPTTSHASGAAKKSRRKR